MLLNGALPAVWHRKTGSPMRDAVTLHTAVDIAVAVVPRAPVARASNRNRAANVRGGDLNLQLDEFSASVPVRRPPRHMDARIRG